MNGSGLDRFKSSQPQKWLRGQERLLFLKRTWFSSQNLHGDSHLPPTPVSEDLAPSPGLHRHQVMHIHVGHHTDI